MTTALLPANQTALEAALVEASTPQSETQPENIKPLYRPEDIPAPLLPWLAWANDVPVWPAWATEKVRRAITAGSWDVHRRQGTLTAYRTVARWLNAEVPYAITPPAKTHLGKSLTVAERNGLLARLTQIRVYPFRSRSTAKGTVFIKETYPGAAHLEPSDATDRYRFHAMWWDGEQETPLTTVTHHASEGDYYEIRQPAAKKYGTHAGAAIGGWLMESTAASRLFSIRPGKPYLQTQDLLHLKPVTAASEPVTARYVSVSIANQRGNKRFCDGDFLTGWPLASDLWTPNYQRFPVLDKDRAGSFAFLDSTRLGFPPYLAELGVRIRSRRGKRHVGRFINGMFGQRGKTQKRVDEVIAGLRNVKATRDQVLAHVRTWDLAKASPAWISGKVICGQAIY